MVMSNNVVVIRCYEVDIIGVVTFGLHFQGSLWYRRIRTLPEVSISWVP